MKVLVLGHTGFIGKNILNHHSTRFEYISGNYHGIIRNGFELTNRDSIDSLLVA